MAQHLSERQEFYAQWKRKFRRQGEVVDRGLVQFNFQWNSYRWLIPQQMSRPWMCIELNQYVFDLKCSLKVLGYDGGLFDCSVLAVTSALIGFRRNDVTYDGLTKRLIQHSASEKPMIPLTMIYKPATTTFGFIEGIEDPIVDPSESECIRIRGYLVIGANQRNEICLMHQSGRINVTPEMIIKCSSFAIEHAKSLVLKMTKAVEDAIISRIISSSQPCRRGRNKTRSIIWLEEDEFVEFGGQEELHATTPFPRCEYFRAHSAYWHIRNE
uniref:Exoribonuclease phosphorolytic domain-containing protein n=1 Tax=Ditylenchus dipsaci TaxID=166011 RepID=A0A915CN18_9BILA